MRDIKFDFVYKGDHRFHHKKYYLSELIANSLSKLSDIHNQMELIASRQYTGLKDKNGVEIYEGDVVEFYSLVAAREGEKTSCFTNGIRETTVLTNHVIYFDKYQGWVAKENSRARQKSFWCSKRDVGKDWCVIGNIYENQELLGE